MYFIYVARERKESAGYWEEEWSIDEHRSRLFNRDIEKDEIEEEFEIDAGFDSEQAARAHLKRLQLAHPGTEIFMRGGE